MNELRLTLSCGSSLQGASGIGRVLGPVAHPVRVAKATGATPNKNRLTRFRRFETYAAGVEQHEVSLELLLALKRHLEKLVPRLTILCHLSHLKPLTLLVVFDRVSHLTTRWNLQSPL